MRPLILTFEGIRSYPGPCPPIDFTGKSLIGIIGDTGAGKSTIFEALCVALYGGCSTPAAEVRDLIASNRPAMSVELTFQHGGTIWRIRRQYYANSRPSQHALENLDTGETFDNARPVTAKIVALTGLNLDAFRSSVLLPQGRFAELLQAPKAKRTQLLEGMFGADTLSAVAERVRQRESTLRDLVHQAELVRNGLLPNPAEEKAKAVAQAEAATALGATLSDYLGKIREDRGVLDIANSEIERLDELSRSLTETLRDLPSLRSAIEKIDDLRRQIDGNDKGLEAEEVRFNETVAKTQSALDDAAVAGNTLQTLAVAESQLKTLTADIVKLIRARENHAAAELELAERGTAQDHEDAAITVSAADLIKITAAAEAAVASTNDIQQAVDDLTGLIDSVFDHGASVGPLASHRAAALQKIDNVTASLPDLAAEIHVRKLALRKATDARDDLQREGFAASAGHDLHEGDPCPVCHQGIPEGYQPASPVDPAAAIAADDLVEKCRADTTVAELALRTAEVTIEEQRKAVDTAQQSHEHAIADAANDLSAVSLSLQTLDRLTAPHDVRLGPNALFARIRQAHDEIAATAADPRRVLRNREKKKITAVLHEYTAAAVERARLASQSASRAEEALTARRRAAKSTRTSIDRDLATLRDNVLATRTSEEELRHTIAALPPVARLLVETPDGAWPTEVQVTAALAAVTEVANQLTEHSLLNTQAHEGLAGLAPRRLTSAHRRSTDVDGPSRATRDRLQGVAGAIEAALAALAEPASIQSPDEASLRTLHDELARALPAVQPRLADLVTARRRSRDDHEDRLKGQLTTALALHLASASQFELARSTTTPTQVPEPVLDDLIMAIGSWQTYSVQAGERAKAAEAQIDKASRLDEALHPARLRLAALKELKELLTPAKFLRYLVETRTSALLGIASEILGTLTADEFGFSENFLIAVRGTGVTREPHTLSGGEKFLGSLALSLALAEVHGHGGNHVDALFLDEGFDSLDLTHLAQALSILRGETQHDRLVTIVTHIHTVAELVDDVLLVKRGPTGSAMTWSTNNDLHDLLWADAAAGLHDIRADFASADSR